MDNPSNAPLPTEDFMGYVASLSAEDRVKLHNQLCTFIAVDKVTDTELTHFSNALAEEMDVEHEVFLASMDDEEREQFDNYIHLEECLSL